MAKMQLALIYLNIGIGADI
uniref:Uncharacterized protein n=1 Tax=Arundo donax TaxID=35708 RepID=A0A0A8YHW4_ARUDO